MILGIRMNGKHVLAQCDCSVSQCSTVDVAQCDCSRSRIEFFEWLEVGAAHRATQSQPAHFKDANPLPQLLAALEGFPDEARKSRKHIKDATP